MARDRLNIRTDLAGLVWPFHAAPSARRDAHTHDELEFNLVRQGTASYLVDGRRYDLAADTLIWLFPAQDHVLIGESADFTMWIAVFRPGLIRRVIRDFGGPAELAADDPIGTLCTRLQPGAAGALEGLCEQIRASMDDPAMHSAGLAWLAVRAWSVFHAHGAAEPGAHLHPCVEQAARLLRRADCPQGVDALADAVGLSASRLSRLFHRQTGMTIVDCRNHHRLERFARHYDRGRRLNMSEAALRAGFGSYAQFHRAFRRRFGVGPAAFYRRRS